MLQVLSKKMRTGLISKISTHLIKIACEVATKKRDRLIINGNNYKTMTNSKRLYTRKRFG